MKNHKKFYLIVVLLTLAFLLSGCAKPNRDGAASLYAFWGEGDKANSYILTDGIKAAVIDPASSGEIITKLKEQGLDPDYIILTHGHFDHIGGIEGILNEYPGVKVLVNPKDRDKLADPGKNVSSMFGSEVYANVKSYPIHEGESIMLMKVSIEVLETPGHTEGSVSLKVDNMLFTGDTLFKGTVGRTDFPGSNPRDLAASLKKLAKLPDDLRILPGHGEPTTLGEEKRSNPFFRIKSPF